MLFVLDEYVRQTNTHFRSGGEKKKGLESGEYPWVFNLYRLKRPLETFEIHVRHSFRFVFQLPLLHVIWLMY